MCPHYEELHAVFAKNPNIDPPHLESSVYGDDERDSVFSAASTEDCDFGDEARDLGITSTESDSDIASVSSSRKTEKKDGAKRPRQATLSEAILSIQEERMNLLRQEADRKHSRREKKDKMKYELELMSLKLRQEELQYKRMELLFNAAKENVKLPGYEDDRVK